MAKNLTSRIILRNDTYGNWQTHNPTLSKGEMGIESDTGKFKFGDGITNWISLAYASMTIDNIPLASDITNGLMSKEDYSKLYLIEPQAQVNLIETISVNGVTLTITAKGVNILVPEGALASKDEISLSDFDSALTTAWNLLATQSYVDNALDNLDLAEYAKLADVYTKSEIDSMISTVFIYKGTVDTEAELPTENNKVGDVWFVRADTSEYAWDGTRWEKLGIIVDLSAYATIEWVNTQLATKIGEGDILVLDGGNANTTYS